MNTIKNLIPLFNSRQTVRNGDLIHEDGATLVDPQWHRRDRNNPNMSANCTPYRCSRDILPLLDKTEVCVSYKCDDSSHSVLIHSGLTDKQNFLGDFVTLSSEKKHNVLRIPVEKVTFVPELNKFSFSCRPNGEQGLELEDDKSEQVVTKTRVDFDFSKNKPYAEVLFLSAKKSYGQQEKLVTDIAEVDNGFKSQLIKKNC